MNTKAIRGTLALFIAGGLLVATACHRHHTPAERADWVTSKISKELGLNDQQKVLLSAVKDEALAARAESRAEHRAIVEAAITEFHSDRMDQAKMTQLIEDHRALQARTVTRVLPKFSEWHASLTPAQKAEAVEHVRAWMERFEDM
ncbi:MAG: Spy/CpxP family protein refolding chaperone [Nitrospiraceae bacterium]